jgi:tetratricopeptide (TPR) repeat protein
MNKILVIPLIVGSLAATMISCGQKYAGPSPESIAQIHLKRGEIISCSPGGVRFGEVQFAIEGPAALKEEFNLGVKLLHSFEYDEAEKVFARIIDLHPDCAMAYWGVAMSNFHPLWAPPSGEELDKGTKALAIAKAIPGKPGKEANYIEALASFYNEWNKSDHRSRCLRFEKAMENLHAKYPADKEAAVFYALALTAAADPTDHSFVKQKKAGDLLNSLYPNEPNHPGIVHYIIHTYDSPELAELALPAARRYASVAPSSAHALHMPSHIFTRLGLWDESISSNIASVNNAQCYAKASGIQGHWDEELHGLDYLVYAYLQKGENNMAKKQWDYVKGMEKVEPLNFKVAYAFAAIPSRYLLENRLWSEAAGLKVDYAGVNWKKFPWQNAIIHATRLMGSVNTGALVKARSELSELRQLYDELLKQKNSFQANQVMVKIKTGEAWISFREGNKVKALALMNEAADMEEKAEKHPVTPGEVIPAREYLADMLLQMNEPARALEMYEADLKKSRNRFNGLYGAGLAAEKSGNLTKALAYYKSLVSSAKAEGNERKELIAAKHFLAKQ